MRYPVISIPLAAGLVTTMAGPWTRAYMDGYVFSNFQLQFLRYCVFLLYACSLRINLYLSAASLDNPAGLCIDNNGNIYVADQTNNRVRATTGY